MQGGALARVDRALEVVDSGFVRRFLVVGALALTFATAIRAVASQADSAASDRPTRPAAFEVTSVKKAQPGLFAISPYGGSQFSINRASLTLLIGIAFGLSDTDIVGGPSWRDSEYYDIVGKAEDGMALTVEEVRPRLQWLLAERFRLVTHREPRRVPGHVLVVTRDGVRLKAADADSSVFASILPTGVYAPSTSMDSFAAILARVVGRPVVNETGLTGSYRVDLDFAADPAATTDLPSVFTALQEQLGLRLDSRTVEVEKLLIDSVERPSDN